MKSKKNISVSIIRFALLALFLTIWQFTSSNKIIDSFYFSSPALLWHQLVIEFCHPEIYMHIYTTLYEAMISFLAIILLAVVTASILWFFPKLGKVLEPTLIVLNSLPKSALAPLIIVWLGTGYKAIILCGVSVGIFGCILHFYQSFLQTDQELIKLIHILGGNRWDILKKIILPYHFPLILSMSKVNIGLALVGVMIGEFLVGKAGLGYLIIYASQTFQLTNMILSICLLCCLSGILYLLIVLIEKILLIPYKGKKNRKL